MDSRQPSCYIYRELGTYEIIEPSLRLNTLSDTNLDRASFAYPESKPKVCILFRHILDSSIWQDEFILHNVVNSKSILTRLV